MNNEERLGGAHFYVYYLCDHSGNILYIGRAQRPELRKGAFERKHERMTHFGVHQRHSKLDDAQEAERAAILKHKPPFNKKVSSTKGMTGKAHSERTKRVIGNKHKGKTQTPEARARMSMARMGQPAHNKGKPMSAESRAKLSASRTGQRHTPEARARMSATRKGRPSPLKGRIIGPHKNKRSSHG